MWALNVIMLCQTTILTILPINMRLLFRTVYKLACIFCTAKLHIFAKNRIIHDPLFTQFSTVINFGHPYMMFDSSGRMQSCAVWKSFNQLSLGGPYASGMHTLIRVSRHYYAIRMFLRCLCVFVSNKAFWSEVEVKYWPDHPKCHHGWSNGPPMISTYFTHWM